MICTFCNNQIEVERLEVLPETKFCAPCARKHDFVKPRKGIMVYDSEASGELQVIDYDAFENKKHYFEAISDASFFQE
jgi:hypothetical protein